MSKILQTQLRVFLSILPVTLALVLGISLVYGGDAQTHFQKGSQLEATKDYQGALTEFQAVLAAQPDNTTAREQLGNCYYYLGDIPQALQTYTTCLKADPSNTKLKEMVDYLNTKVAADATSNKGNDNPTAGMANSDQTSDKDTKEVINDSDEADTDMDHEIADALGEKGIKKKPFHSQWGIRLRGGYGWGLTNNVYGQQATADNTNPIQFPYGLGEGISYGAEITYSISPSFEIGLGVFPLSINTSDQAYIQTTLTAQSYNPSVLLNEFPVMAHLYNSTPLSKDLNIFTGFGVGIVLGQNYVQNSTTSTTDILTGRLATTTGTFTASYDPTAAFRGVIGAEYKLNKHFSLALDVALLLANLTANQTVNQEITTHSGGEVDTTLITNNFVASPPVAVGATTTETTSQTGNRTTTVDTSDNGVTQIVTTTVTNTAHPNIVYSKNTIETSTLLAGSSTDNLHFNQLSTALTLIYRF